MRIELLCPARASFSGPLATAVGVGEGCIGVPPHAIDNANAMLPAKISEALEAIKLFDKLLPRTNYKPEIERIKSGKKKVNLSLQEEILEIKEKLRKLQGGM